MKTIFSTLENDGIPANKKFERNINTKYYTQERDQHALN